MLKFSTTHYTFLVEGEVIIGDNALFACHECSYMDNTIIVWFDKTLINNFTSVGTLSALIDIDFAHKQAIDDGHMRYNFWQDLFIYAILINLSVIEYIYM